MHVDAVVPRAIFGLFLTVSVCRQFYAKKPRWLRLADPLNLIPTYRFFGPIPITHDYRLFFRDFTECGHLAGWVEITPHPSRSVYSCIWNPGRRPRKVFGMHVERLRRSPTKAFGHDDGGHHKATTGSSSYRALLTYVLHLPPSPGAIKRQFAVTQSRDLTDCDRVEIVFQSILHDLPQMHEPHLP